MPLVFGLHQAFGKVAKVLEVAERHVVATIGEANRQAETDDGHAFQ